MDGIETRFEAIRKGSKHGKASEIQKTLDAICERQKLKRMGCSFPSHYFGRLDGRTVNVYNIVQNQGDNHLQDNQLQNNHLQDDYLQKTIIIETGPIIGSGPVTNMYERFYAFGEYQKTVKKYYDE